MSRRGAGRTAATSVLALVLLAGCVPASPDVDTYEGKVSVTVGAALSEVATVQKILQLLQEGRIFRATAIAQMRDSQSSLDTNTGAFNEVRPPPALDRVFKRTNTLLSDATDTTNKAGLAIERKEVGRYPDIAAQLGKLADQLDRLESRVS